MLQLKLKNDDITTKGQWMLPLMEICFLGLPQVLLPLRYQDGSPVDPTDQTISIGPCQKTQLFILSKETAKGSFQPVSLAPPPFAFEPAPEFQGQIPVPLVWL